MDITICFYDTVHLRLFILSNTEREITSNISSSTKPEIASMFKTNVEIITKFAFCRKTDT